MTYPEERRSTPRVPLREHVVVWSEAGEFVGQTEDVSARGLRVCSLHRAAAGTRVSLSLPVRVRGGTSWALIDAVVTRLEEAPGSRHLMGLRVLQPNLALEALVETRLDRACFSTEEPTPH